MNFNLIIELAKRDFIERYSGSVLGFIWSFIHPLITILIYMIVFGSIMGARLPGMPSIYGYGIYLVSGLILWLPFSNTISRASTVFNDKKYIIAKIHVDLPPLPIFIVLSESVTFVVTLVIFIIFLLCTGYSLSIYFPLILIIYLFQQVFAYALGFFIGMFVVFLRDLREVVIIGLQIWFWFTPIVYVFDILPPLAQQILIWNPALAFISASHDIFIYQKLPSVYYLSLVTLVSVLLIALDFIIFKKLEKDIRDFI